MIIHFAGPKLAPGRSIKGVGIGFSIGEVDGVSGSTSRILARTNGYCGSHVALRLEAPVNASRLRIQGINSAGFVCDEQPSTRDDRLRSGARCAGNAEGPFQFEGRNLSGGQRALFRRLEARIREAGAPAIPVASSSWIAHRFRRGTEPGTRVV